MPLFFSLGQKSAFTVIVSERWDAGLNAYDKTHCVQIARTQAARQLGLRLVCVRWTAQPHPYKQTHGDSLVLFSTTSTSPEHRFNTNAFMAAYVEITTMKLTLG